MVEKFPWRVRSHALDLSQSFGGGSFLPSFEVARRRETGVVLTESKATACLDLNLCHISNQCTSVSY